MIKKIIITLICILTLPVIVNADMGLPMTTSYEVLVTNSNGAQTYDYDGNKLDKIFDFNEELIVVMETTIDGDLYLSIDYSNGDRDYTTYYIKESDVTISSEVDLDRLKNEESRKLYVFDEGAILYKGPSIKYGIVEDSEIPVGTTLTYQHSDELWAYVNYNGKKGWIYKYTFEGFGPYENFETKVCDVSESSLIVVKEEIELYEKPNYESNKQKITIPRNTIITYDKSLGYSPHYSFIFIKYGEYEGWVINGEENHTFSFPQYGYETEQIKYMAIDSITMTEFPGSGESIIVIPKGKKFEVDLYYYYEEGIYDDNYNDRYYYLEYNGKKGWINEEKLATHSNSNLLAMEDINLIKDINSNEVSGTIKKYEEIKEYYIYWDDFTSKEYKYIEKGKVKGWYKNENNKFAESISCSQFFVLDEKGETLTSLKGEKVTIPYHAVLTELYIYYGGDKRTSIVEYKGEKYTLVEEEMFIGTSVYNTGKRFFDKNDPNATLKVYSDEHLETLDFEIANGEEFDVLFECGCCGYHRYFISYKGKKGWILDESDKLEYLSGERTHCLVNDNLEMIKEDPNVTSNTQLDSNLIIITCVIGAIAISLTALVTILIINKQRKKKRTTETEPKEIKEENNLE